MVLILYGNSELTHCMGQGYAYKKLKKFQHSNDIAPITGKKKYILYDPKRFGVIWMNNSNPSLSIK